MAQEGQLTPEKQLLKLIEDQKEKPRVALQADSIRYHSLSLLSPGAWLGRISFLRGQFKKRLEAGFFNQLDIVKLINNILGLVIFVLVLYFISSFSFSVINIKKMPNLQFKIKEGSKVPIVKETTVLKAASYYLEKIRQRNIFKIGAKKLPQEEEAAGGPVLPIAEATANLRLVGISWSDDPDAMIEDTKAGRTFFVKRGQMIGDVQVKAILKDKIILGFGKQEAELR